MTLRERLERDGELLFKWRSYTPLIPLIAAALWVVSQRDEPPLDERAELVLHIACIAIGLLGVAFRVFTVGYAGRGSSGRTTEVPRAGFLNTSGPYSLVRHPLYVGNFMIWLAVAAYSYGVLITLIVIAWFWLQYERIALAEEAFLRAEFGPAFEAWAARTPAFVPRLRNWEPPGKPFAWSAALRREGSAFLAMSAAFALLDAARSISRSGELRIATSSAILVGIAATFYIAVTLPRVIRRARRRAQLRQSPRP